MKGLYPVSVQNNKVKYEFTVRRNITVIQGDSATRKTTLVDLIREHQLEGNDSGVSLSCRKKCVVLEGADWQRNLSLYEDCIVFIDEGNRFIATPDFARTIQATDNYYVLVTREGLENLPYSVEEIYGIHVSGKYAGLRQVYHEFYHIYGPSGSASYGSAVASGSMDLEKVGAVLCEDSNAGFEFFNFFFSNKLSCESARGKSNIFRKVQDSDRNMLVIADGAAFGSQMAKMMKTAFLSQKCVLFLPESFEYLLLSSLFSGRADVRKILESPSDGIESREYFSWERFFTSLLMQVTEGTYLKYAKGRLNPNYLSERVLSAVVGSRELKGLLFFTEDTGG